MSFFKAFLTGLPLVLLGLQMLLSLELTANKKFTGFNEVRHPSYQELSLDNVMDEILNLTATKHIQVLVSIIILMITIFISRIIAKPENFLLSSLLIGIYIGYSFASLFNILILLNSSGWTNQICVIVLIKGVFIGLLSGIIASIIVKFKTNIDNFALRIYAFMKSII